MSFRTRLTSFFVLIVVVPMVAMGFLVFRLIGDSEQGKADARASGVATAAASVYTSAGAASRSDAQTLARDAAVLGTSALRARLPRFVSQAGLVRVRLTVGGRTLADVGDHSAIAPGTAFVRPAGSRPIVVTVSELTAPQYARELSSSGTAVVVTQGSRVLASGLPATKGVALPSRGTVTIASMQYRTVTQSFAGFAGPSVHVVVLSDLSATATSVTTSRIVAAVFIAGFLLLAFSFSVLASRALEGQLGRFLQAARRLAGGDFSSPIQTDGHDEFAALGDEFNNMSDQLARRIDELREERARLRDSIHRIGQTFAANLDRPALLDLALRTAIDAIHAECGRVSVRSRGDEPLTEMVSVGSLAPLQGQILEAERTALRDGGFGESASDGVSVASVALGPMEDGGRAHGLITVARGGHELTEDDREVLRSLGASATLALENVELHFQVRRQAVTDELTGLANHGRFQELLSAEIEQVRRYGHPVGLIMLDIDDFKSINDTYGHQQGDVVLNHVGRIVRETSREADLPARYGGEEMAVILPHTDPEGSFAIAERVRSAIEGLRIPRLDGEGVLRITASVGVAASAEGNKDGLIADADSALYTAKHQGKNRTVRAPARTTNVSTAE